MFGLDILMIHMCHSKKHIILITMMLKLYIILFVIFNFINFNQSQQLINSEYECVKSIVIKIGPLPLVNNQGYIDFCAIEGYECALNINDGNTYLISVVFVGKTTIEISPTDTFCFSKLTKLSIESYKLSANFVHGPFQLSLISLKINNSIGITMDQPISETIQELRVTLAETLNGIILLSTLKNLNNFELGIGINGGGNIKFNNDLIEKKKFEDFIIYTTEVPTLYYIDAVNLVILFNGALFDIGSINTFTSFTGSFGTLYLKATAGMPKITNTNNAISIDCNTFISEIPYEATNTLLDLSFWPSNSFSINKATEFNFNGRLPFLKLPSLNLDQFSFINGKLSVWPDFLAILPIETRLNLKIDLSNNQFKMALPKWKKLNGTVDSLNIGSNGLTGTLDESYCELKLTVSGNQLSGKIPTCFLCYAMDQTLFSNIGSNNFTNYFNSNPCTTIVPNLYFDSFTNRLWLFGSDLGFGHYIQTMYDAQQISWKLSVNSHKYYTDDLKLPLISNEMYLSFPHSNDGGKQYTLSIFQQIPIVYSIKLVGNTQINNQIIISGYYLSYNTSIIKVYFNGISSIDNECIVNESSFNSIICTLSDRNSLFNGTKNLMTTVNVYVGEFESGNLNSCIDLCNLASTCNVDGGGVCECDPLGNCNGNGVCQSTNPKDGCKCVNGYGGLECFYKDHYASAIDPVSVKGGQVIIYGMFTIYHINLQVFIGTNTCDLVFYNETLIMCNISEGQGEYNVTIIQNGITWIGNKFFKYLVDPTLPIQCPNDCTNVKQGTCNTGNGQCNCIKGWGGPSCSLLEPNGNTIPNSNTTVNTTTGTTTITNQLINFDISILQLLEVDINGETVDQYSLESNWNVNVTSNDKIYTFNQTIQPGISNIIYHLEEILIDKEVEFASVKFLLTAGSIKTSVSIYNYKFKSSLNTLKLIFKSKVGINDKNQDIKQCNGESDDPIIENISNNQNLNYLSIKKGGKTLSGRFINRVLSDGKSTFISTQVIKNQTDSSIVLVSLNLPHFGTDLIIDPDFSLLIDVSTNQDCNDSSTDRGKWFLPVVIVVPVVGVSCLVILGFIIYRRNITSIKVGVAKLKQFNK